MAAGKTPKSLLRAYGAKLLANGYSIIPIPAGTKAPVGKGWQNIKATEGDVNAWAANARYRNGNIGFLAKYTPAVDIDIYDEEMAQLMRAHTEEIIGKTMSRVGQAPKIMLIYRTDDPFTKRKVTYLDEDQVKHSIEILADGQQFVGIGIHPDTKKPYRWQSMDMSPIGMDASFLPEITLDHIDTLFDVFDMEAKRRGWTKKKHQAESTSLATMDENDSALLSHKPPLENITTEQIAEILNWVPNNDDYEEWLKVGMALHHQYDGNEEGLQLWHDWSETAHNYDSDALEFKWNSFHDEMGRNITTVATLIKIAKDFRVEHAAEQFDKIIAKVKEATNPQEILTTLAAKWGKQLESDFQIDMVAQAIAARIKELTGNKPRIEVCRKAVKEGFKSSFDYKEIPHWCQNVVYVDSDEQFFLMDNRLALSERAFNARNNRHLLSKKDRSNMEAIPEQQAAQLALNVFQIPVASGYIYLPGAERIVEWADNQHVNLFNADDLTPLPDRLTSKDKRAIEAVKRHFEISYPVAREREILLSWLAYTLKRMDKKVRWAVVLQGVDGAGKGFLGEMLMAILGKNNVVTVSAQALEEKYTSFFENKKVVVLEEARIHGTSRYAVMDKLKPFITNDVVDIRRMHKDTYNIPSCTNTMILTNHADALPVYDADRRYFVIGTSFQTREQIEKFRLKHPDHFDDLFNAIAYHAGAIREWLEDHPLHDEFDPDGHAPQTEAKTRMMELSRGDENDDLEDLIHNSRDPEVSPLLLNVSRLRDLAMDYSAIVPYGPKLSAYLSSKGYVYVGRARNEDGRQCRYWSKSPTLFPTNGLQHYIDDFLELAHL